MISRNIVLLSPFALLLVATLLCGASAFLGPAPSTSTLSLMQKVKPQSIRSMPSNFSTQSQPPQFQWSRSMASSDDNTSAEKKLPMLLDPGTKGGALFLSLVLFIIPILFYQFVTSVFGFDGIEAGKWIGGGFTVIATLAWVGTYIFRVATKDMTYAKQLKDYENAVIAKRLEELDEDELQALVEEVERDEF